jgi:hypothetical protein
MSNVAEKVGYSQHIVQVTDEKGFRWYEREGKRYISVTQVLDVAQHKTLTNWFKNNSKAAIEKKVTSAADIGTRLHKLVENDLKHGLSIKELYTGNEDVKPAIDNWLQKKQEYNIKALLTEQIVWSDKYGFAGTLDMFITGNFNKQYNVADLKTGTYSIKTGWQVAAYRQAFIETQKYKREEVGCVGISIHRDGRPPNIFEYQHYESCFKAFLQCLGIFKALYFNQLKDWEYLTKDHLKEYYGIIEE